ncbi:MAG TPA: ribose-5-phosphate isomerase RpiA [Nitrospiraceae bacterium]|nr:ribose-5-phosphate isomerase RpiA [Nitrospiraceae bacterium]
MSTAESRGPFKEQAAAKAVEFIRPGMVVGLGTGSTAEYMLALLGQKVREGLEIRGVPTSLKTAALARRHGIPLIDAEDDWAIDVALDGADQADPHLNLIKGGGGALLKEKIVAAAAKQFIVMVDHSKCVPVLGASCPLPIEVVPFGWRSTAKQIESLAGAKTVIRRQEDQVFRTEAGHYILDLHAGGIEDPARLERDLNRIAGVVETGLFVGRATLLIIGRPEGVRLIEA